jgi:hypothetical protein
MDHIMPHEQPHSSDGLHDHCLFLQLSRFLFHDSFNCCARLNSACHFSEAKFMDWIDASWSSSFGTWKPLLCDLLTRVVLGTVYYIPPSCCLWTDQTVLQFFTESNAHVNLQQNDIKDYKIETSVYRLGFVQVFDDKTVQFTYCRIVKWVIPLFWKFCCF